MLVLRGDIADAGVEADGVVLAADAGELCVERAGVGDRQQVRPVALQARVPLLFDVIGAENRL